MSLLPKTSLLSTETQRGKIIILVTLMLFVPQLAIDLYLPSMPAMQSYFATSHSYIQATLVCYLIGAGFTQLIYGPLCDKYGRRPIALIALIIFFLGSLGCIKANTIDTFLLCRLVQGAGCGASGIIYRVAVRDLYEDSALLKISSYVNMVWVLVPIIAPAIGGYVQHYSGWRMNFVIIFLLSAVAIFAMWRLFPETRRHVDPTTVTEHTVAKKYLSLLSNPTFLIFACSAMLLNAMMLGYNNMSPFIFQTSLHLTPILFGWTAILAAGGYMLGSFINGRVVTKENRHLMIARGLALTLLSAIALVLLGLFGYFTVASVLIPVTFLSAGWGVTFPNCSGGAMQPFRHMAGTAAAMLGFIQTGIGVIVSSLVLWLPHSSAVPLGLFCLTLTIILIVLLSRVKQHAA